jgi:hypothetical protein
MCQTILTPDVIPLLDTEVSRVMSPEVLHGGEGSEANQEDQRA